MFDIVEDGILKSMIINIQEIKLKYVKVLKEDIILICELSRERENIFLTNGEETLEL